MRRSRPDLPSLVAGLALLAFGAVLALHAGGVVELGFAWLGPLAFGVLGAILLALGLSRGE
jgi:hypothetical protein